MYQVSVYDNILKYNMKDSKDQTIKDKVTKCLEENKAEKSTFMTFVWQIFLRIHKTQIRENI